MKQSSGYLAVSGAAFLWGISGVLAKYLFSEHAIPPLLLVQIRMFSSAALLLLALALLRPSWLKIPAGHIRFLLIWGVMGMACVQFSYFYTLSLTNVATAIFLQYTAPVMTALYARWAHKRPLGGSLLSCLGLAVAGSTLLIFGGGTALMVSPLGLAWGLISAVCFSFYTVYGQKGLGQMNPWAVLGYGMAAGCLFWVLVDVVLALVGHGLPVGSAFSSLSLWGFYLYIAIFATIVPFGLYLSGLRHVPATQATITAMLEPVVAAVGAYLLLAEQMAPLQIAGGTLIISAVLLQTWLQQRAAVGVDPAV